MNITVKEVTSRKELRRFVRFPNELYKDNRFYVPQIESMDMDTLDPKKNHAFEVCEARYFLAYDNLGEIVGRVAVIINHAYNEKVNERICRFGWLDFIDDPDVSKALMDTVTSFAREKGLERLSGPVGFLEFDASGVLVEGFDEYPTAYGKYNAPYYDSHLKSLGFSKETDWVEFSICMDNYNRERDHRAASLVAERFKLHQAPIRSRRDIYKYCDGIFSVMNDCYDRIHGYSRLSDGQIEDLKKQFIPNADPDLVSIILNEKEEVIAFSIWMPSLSKALIKAKGHLFPFGFIHILRALKHNDTMDTLLIAIDDRYKHKGVSAMIFDKIFHGVNKIGARYLETTRELETNDNVQNLFSKFSPRLHKRARCYTKNVE